MLLNKSTVWADQERRATFQRYGAWILCAGGATLWVYHGLRALLDHRWFYVAFYAPAVVSCICGLLLIQPLFRRRFDAVAVSMDDVVSKPGVLSVRMSRRGVALHLAMIAAMGVAGAVFAIGMWSGALDFPMSPGQRTTFPYTLAFLALGAAASLLIYPLGWARLGRVDLMASKVTFVTTHAEQTVEWDDIVELREKYFNSEFSLEVVLRDSACVESEVVYGGLFSMAKQLDKRVLLRKVDRYGVGAVPLRNLLRYYVNHPERRYELTDGRAYDRLVSGSMR